MGLKPIAEEKWISFNPSQEVLRHKEILLANRYHDVVAVTDNSIPSQQIFSDLTGIPTTIDFHLELLDRNEFLTGDVHTKFVEQEMLD